jgi:integrase
MRGVDSAAPVFEAGIAVATSRAYARDIAYFWAWAAVAERREKPNYPVPLSLLQAYALAHLQGLSEAVVTELHARGCPVTGAPLAVATVRRRLASLSVAHSVRGVSNPCRDPGLKLLLRRAARVREPRRVQTALTGERLAALVATCGSDLRGLRDRALLRAGFSGGGRRRSELAALAMGDLVTIPGGYLARLTRHKTARFGEVLEFPLLGEAAAALDAWLAAAGLVEGPVFRAIDRHGRIAPRALSGRSINRIVKARAQAAGEDPARYGAHSLRLGFITESARQGISLPEAMALSGHRSLRVALGYYRAGEVPRNRAARLRIDTRSPTVLDQVGNCASGTC